MNIKNDYGSLIQKKNFNQDVIILGSLNMDLNLETNRLPDIGETFEGSSFYVTPGGKGGNQAVAVSRSSQLKNSTHMIATVGDDFFGKELITFLVDEKIDTNNIHVVSNVSSGIAVIFLFPDGENSVNSVYGANAIVNDQNVISIKKLSRSSSILLCQHEIPLQVNFNCMKIAKENGLVTILDPAPSKIIPKDYYDYIDIITPNELEAEYLSGVRIKNINDAKLAADKISDFGVKNVIITLGENGCWLLSNEYVGHIDSHNVDVIASVAAGDAFNGCLASRLSEGFNLEQSVRFASIGAALSVSKKGAQESMPYYQEIEKLLD
tara:strand:+ start:128 stop:1096 length:969 start_codon:yes stop_codon:yes gene_type:complete